MLLLLHDEVFLRYLCTHGHIILLDNAHQYSLRPVGGIAGSEALPAPPVWWEPGCTYCMFSNLIRTLFTVSEG